jgi:hypothetical protein
VRDDEGYEQFEILFASSGIGKKKHTGACKCKEYWCSYLFTSSEAVLNTMWFLSIFYCSDYDFLVVI